MKYIVPQDFRGMFISNHDKLLAKDFISKQEGLSIKEYADGPVRAIDFLNFNDLKNGIHKLVKGYNLILMGKGKSNFSIIVYKS